MSRTDCKRGVAMWVGRLVRFTLLVFVASAAGPSDVHAAPRVKDSAALDGEWQVTFFAVHYNRVSSSDDGDPITVDTDIKLTFKDSKLTISNGTDSFTWRIDRAEQAEGKLGEIDLVAETAKLRPQKGIFSLDKDVLILCYPPNGADRPKELKIKPNEQGFLIRAKRVK